MACLCACGEKESGEPVLHALHASLSAISGTGANDAIIASLFEVLTKLAKTVSAPTYAFVSALFGQISAETAKCFDKSRIQLLNQVVDKVSKLSCTSNNSYTNHCNINYGLASKC